MLKRFIALSFLPCVAFAQSHNVDLRLYGPDQALSCQGTLAFAPNQSPYFYLENTSDKTYDGTLVLRANRLDTVNMGCQSRVHIQPHEYQQINCHLSYAGTVLPSFGYITLDPEFINNDNQRVSIGAVDTFGLYGPYANGRPGSCTTSFPVTKAANADSFILGGRFTTFVQQIDQVSDVPFNTLQQEFATAVASAQASTTSCDQPTWVVTPIPTKVNQQLIPNNNTRVFMFVKPVTGASCPTKEFSATFDFVSAGSPIKVASRQVTMSNKSNQLRELKLWTAHKSLAEKPSDVRLSARLANDANGTHLNATRQLSVTISADGASEDSLFVSLSRPEAYRPIFLTSHKKA